MSSARMLELVNSLHHDLSVVDSYMERFPFAGKQIILVGEFLQLRPVPNLFDAGDFMFRSQVVESAITPRLMLTTIQSTSLHLLSQWKCAMAWSMHFLKEKMQDSRRILQESGIS